jgi:hypothetical protein
MQGFQLTWAPPGHNSWPNGQIRGLCSKIDTGTKMIMPSGWLLSPPGRPVRACAGLTGRRTGRPDLSAHNLGESLWRVYVCHLPSAPSHEFLNTIADPYVNFLGYRPGRRLFHRN